MRGRLRGANSMRERIFVELRGLRRSAQIQSLIPEFTRLGVDLLSAISRARRLLP